MADSPVHSFITGKVVPAAQPLKQPAPEPDEKDQHIAKLQSEIRRLKEEREVMPDSVFPEQFYERAATFKEARTAERAAWAAAITKQQSNHPAAKRLLDEAHAWTRFRTLWAHNPDAPAPGAPTPQEPEDAEPRVDDEPRAEDGEPAAEE